MSNIVNIIDVNYQPNLVKSGNLKLKIDKSFDVNNTLNG